MCVWHLSGYLPLDSGQGAYSQMAIGRDYEFLEKSLLLHYQEKAKISIDVFDFYCD
jgi:hypothetical protein